MQLTEFLHSGLALLPEVILVLAVCVIVVADMFVSLGKSRQVTGLIGVVALAAAFIAAAEQFAGNLGGSVFSGTLVVDKLSLLFKLIFFAGGFLTLLFALRSDLLKGFRFGEFSCLLLGAVFGASLLASANDFVVFILALETLSMCSYVLAGYLKGRRSSAEAGLKYTLYGAVASAVMFYGIRFLYGLGGTLQISSCMGAIAPQLLGSGAVSAIVALILVLVGLGFKIAMVPFHFWCPDTYEGAPTPVTAFLSVVSKAAGFAGLFRLLLPVLTSTEFVRFFGTSPSLDFIQLLFGALAVVTMTYGNLVALRQTNLKRLLAYSSIAHAGYLLMGFAVFNSAALAAMLLYLMIYLFMNLGAFWVATALENVTGSLELNSLKGLAVKTPTLFVVLFICLVSLTGLPPTAGFVAKLQLFNVVVSAGLSSMSDQGVLQSASWFYLSLALIGVLNSVISLYYYMKIARVMAFEKSESDAPVQTPLLDRLYAVALVVPVLVLLNFGPLNGLVAQALNIAG